MGEQTRDEAIADDQSILGARYGEAFYHCCQEFWRVSSSWDRYEALFGSEERVGILNEASPPFWSAMQDMMLEHVLLGLCRLTDPANTGRFTNMSVSYLEQLDPTAQKAGLASRVRMATTKTSFARTWRDKRIAHNDRSHILGTPAAPLARATRQRIRSSLLAVHDVLRWIRARYFNSEQYLIEMGDDDVNGLLSALMLASQVRKERQAALDRGEYTSFDQWLDPWPKDDYGRLARYSKQQKRPLPKRYRGRLPLST